MTTRATAALLGGLALTGCVELAPARVEVVQGSASAPRRVLALPMTCGGFGPSLGAQRSERGTCLLALPPSATAKIRAELEMRGMSLVDAETINAEKRERRETLTMTEDAAQATIARERTAEGARFDEAPRARQAELARELGVDGVLTVRGWVGPGTPFAGRRVVRVQLRVLAAGSGALVWASRCDVEVDARTSSDLALERAAVCAVTGRATS